MSDNTTFFQWFVPPLPTGKYKIEATLDIQTSNSKDSDKLEAFFNIEAPNSALEDKDIYARFPAPESKEHCCLALPQIFFNRITLPWERTLSGERYVCKSNLGDNVAPATWLALLLFDESETISAKDIVVSDISKGNVLTCNIPKFVKEQATIKVIDISIDLWFSTVPTAADLEYLAHGRKVEAKSSVVNDSSRDNEYSILSCNRLPKASDSGVINSLFLVSLEGLKDYLPDGKKVDEVKKYNAVRLICFDTWNFTAISGDFQEVFEALDVDTIKAKVEDYKELPDDIADIIKKGNLPLHHITRCGEQSFSWYRSPCVPLFNNVDVKKYNDADSALVFYPKSSIFDVSYSAAWQLGRLMILSKPQLATKICKMRNKALRMARVSIVNKVVSAKCRKITDEVSVDSSASEVLMQSLVNSIKEKGGVEKFFGASSTTINRVEKEGENG